MLSREQALSHVVWGSITITQEPLVASSPWPVDFPFTSFFDHYLAQAPFELAVIDDNLRLVYFNQRSYDSVLRREKLKLVPGLPIEKLKGVDLTELRQLLAIAQAEGQISLNYEVKEPDGSAWYAIHIHCIAVENRHYFPVHGMGINDLRRSVNLLQESEDRFRQLFENSPVAMIYHDHKGHASYLSPMISELWQQPLPKLYKNNWLQQLNISPSYLESLDQQGSKMAPKDLPLKGRHYRVFSIKLQAEHQQEPHYLSALLDQTEILKNREKLSDYQQRLAVATQFAGIGTWEYRLHSGQLIWDDQMWNIFGQEKPVYPQLTIEFFQHCLHPEDRDHVMQEFRQALDEDRFYTGTFRILDRNLRLKYIQAYAKKVQAQGEPIAIGINYDVTREQLNSIKVKELNRELQYKEERLRNILEQGRDAILIHNEEGLILYGSTSVQNVTGFHPDELLGQNIKSYFVEAHFLPEEDWQAFLAKPGATFTIESRFLSKTGEKITVETNVTNLLFEPSVQGIVANFRDISLRVKSMETQEKAMRLSEELNQMKSNFLANMSHELRTPLNGLMGITQILQNNFGDDPETQELLEMQKESGERLLRTLTGLIEFSKLDAQAANHRPKPIEMQDLLAQLGENKKEMLTKKQQELMLQMPAKPVWVEGDSHMIQEILGHLLDNASKFSDQGTISISLCSSADNFVEIAIADKGIGIDPDQQGRIFEPFVQESVDYRHRRYQGTGLGLAIVKRYLQLIGGTIHVKSTVGLGSTFTVRIPQNTPSNEQTKAKHP